ncbi:hypothetical protein KUTeg_008584 [Tegillarca granosa]|uniref:Uncharacterized protein n=1 Tax=Tegillarca granosa TaxID=220873 RepID=A0ABQ9FED8_TEGGR|nr:hypothetical protein KUTeg_008584 [Tegillarca granosa]
MSLAHVVLSKEKYEKLLREINDLKEQVANKLPDKITNTEIESVNESEETESKKENDDNLNNDKVGETKYYSESGLCDNSTFNKEELNEKGKKLLDILNSNRNKQFNWNDKDAVCKESENIPPKGITLFYYALRDMHIPTELICNPERQKMLYMLGGQLQGQKTLGIKRKYLHIRDVHEIYNLKIQKRYKNLKNFSTIINNLSTFSISNKISSAVINCIGRSELSSPSKSELSSLSDGNDKSDSLLCESLIVISNVSLNDTSGVLINVFFNCSTT